MDLSAEGRQQSGQGKALRLPELLQQRGQIVLIVFDLTAEQPQGLRQSYETGEAVCHQHPQRAELRPPQQVSIVDGLQQIPEGEVHGDAFQLCLLYTSGKGLRSQVGTMFATKEKGPRYLEMAEGYCTRVALNKDSEIIGYEFVNLGKMMEAVKKGVDANEALESAKSHYGQWDSAAKYIDPRQE